MGKKLSVVIPAFNEEEMLPKAVKTISGILDDFTKNAQKKGGGAVKAAVSDYELIFIDDGSRDGTWKKIQEAAALDEHVRGVSFSRNFGKESAIYAGLAVADGDCIAVMDCDLQHPPAVLPQMLSLWEEGYEVIEGVKKSRGKESSVHAASAGLFYRIMTWATHIDMSRASDFKLLDRKAVDAILSMPEKNAFFRAMSSWVGFKTASVEFDVQEREAGTSKWSTLSLIKYAISNIVGYSTAPMQIVTGAGVLVFMFAVILGIQTLIRYITGHAATGFTTVILLLLLLGSIIMMSLGIIGYYISRIFVEVQSRPRYIIRELTGQVRKDIQ